MDRATLRFFTNNLLSFLFGLWINHNLGDIDVIAALGDSLTAASGASSVRVTDLVIENRGLSWSIGGQWSFKNSTTLPNILKGNGSTHKTKSAATFLMNHSIFCLHAQSTIQI